MKFGYVVLGFLVVFVVLALEMDVVYAAIKTAQLGLVVMIPTVSFPAFSGNTRGGGHVGDRG